MDRKLYIMSDEYAIDTIEENFASESMLQRIIETNPNILSRPWNGAEHDLYLIQREMPTRVIEDEGNSFALDHLLVDDEGVPVLVEVKRSCDTRTRREVVAQMLDYACRASSWNIDDLSNSFFQSNPDVPQDRFSEEFWDKFSANLQSGHFRLAFVSDVIPDTLRVLIEFLDKSMNDIEVYGVEIRQFKSEGTTLLTKAIIGNSLLEKRMTRRRFASRKPWEVQEFLDELQARGLSACLSIAQEIIEYSSELGIVWVGGNGSQYPALFAKLGKERLFSLDLWERGGKPVCTTDYNTLVLSPLVGLSVEEFRNRIVSIPSKEIAEEKEFIWYTASQKWQYIDIRAFENEADMLYLKEILRFITTQIAQ